MATIHLILQGKGGVGKSMIAAFLYQALRHFGKEVIAYDTDPVNSTLAAFAEFNVTTLSVMKDGKIDDRSFDSLLEAIMEVPQDAHVIVATAPPPLSHSARISRKMMSSSNWRKLAILFSCIQSLPEGRLLAIPAKAWPDLPKPSRNPRWSYG